MQQNFGAYILMLSLPGKDILNILAKQLSKCIEIHAKTHKSCINHRSWHCTTALHFHISNIVIVCGEYASNGFKYPYTCLSKLMRSCAPLKAHMGLLVFAMRLLFVNEINHQMARSFMHQCLNSNTPKHFFMILPNRVILYMVMIHVTANTWNKIPHYLNSGSQFMFLKSNCSNILLNWNHLHTLLKMELYWWLK